MFKYIDYVLIVLNYIIKFFCFILLKISVFGYDI